MKKNILMGCIVFALAVLGISTSDAQMCGCGMMGGDNMPMMGAMEPKGMGHGMKDGGMMDMMDEGHRMMKNLMSLDLDEKQKESVRDIKSKVMKETIKKKAEKQVAKLELKELLGKYSVDIKAVESKLKQIEALRTDMELSHIKALESVKTLLTDAQKMQLKEMSEARHMPCGDKECCMMQHEAGAKPEKKAEKKPAGHKH